MKFTKRKPPLLQYTLLLLASMMLCSQIASALESKEEQAPGRSMAQQATKSKKLWRTTDHSKHEILQQDFKSGEQVTQACISCHSEAEKQFHKTIHWTWLADPSEKKQEYGKAGNSLNNFCISTNKNADASCLACHPGWGTSKESPVNCLVCHSQTSMNFDEAMTDIQGFIEEGDEESLEMASEIQAELRDAAQNIGLPARKNCGSCHFYGGGGDGVKHGDLDTSLAKPSKTLDVHMGVDGQDFTCTRCHTTTLHNISGRVYTRPAATDRKSLVEDDLTTKITCESCHTAQPHKGGKKMNEHTDKVACQSCHISEFARVNPTKMSWDWAQSGKLKNGKKYKTKDDFGKYDYMSIKGQMKWAKNVEPDYFWYNGVIKSVTAKDKIDPSGIVKVSWPVGERNDTDSRIYPFKVHMGNQPYDKINQTLLMPLLSSKKGYWDHLNWIEALTVGQESMGLPFSGEFDFVETSYVFPITHMVAPKDQTLSCSECHSKSDSRLANLTGFYMPGRDGSRLLNYAGWGVVLANLVGVLIHALGRIFSRNNGRNKKE
ncbi:MAG: tetrathionate reductase family octaheme c-type cytochrome [Desulfobacterales bacterium]|nr:tetrathionate reductase family octaheme c-type cytochrome [Desulfobacterales bacterium]